MLRGFVRKLKGQSAEVQESELRAAGVKVIYKETLPEAIGSLRVGDMLAVAGLHILGSNRARIVAALDSVHERGAAVHDVITGLNTNGHKAATLLSNAISVMANTERGPDGSTAKKAGALGAIQSIAARRKGKMPMSEAAQYWFDKRLTTAEAMAQINGHPDYQKEWSMVTLYRRLGARQVPAGPRNAKTRITGIVVQEKAKTRAKSGYIYFMRINGRGPVKIGFATNVKERLGSHKTSNHQDCIVVATMHGTPKVERELHKKYEEFRLPRKKEWFYMRGALKAFVLGLPQIETDEDE